MNRVNDEFALWSEDFTDRMKRMCEEADAKRPEFERQYRRRRSDSILGLVIIGVTAVGTAYFVGWLLSQL